MALTNVKAPSSRFLNEHRLSKFEKNPSFKSLSLNEKYKSRENYCKILGWKLSVDEDGNKCFYNTETNQTADIFIKEVDNGKRLYIPISDEPDVTLAYNLVISGCGSNAYVRPNEWKLLGSLYKKKRNPRKKTVKLV